MKAFSIHTLAVASFALLTACSAQQASVVDYQDSAVDNKASIQQDGPYLEDTDAEVDGVILHIGSSSSSSVQQ